MEEAVDEFQRLRLQNTERFQKTLLNYQQTYEYEQEIRQIRLHEEYISLTVNVAREDYPQIQGTIQLNYLYSAAQGYWLVFLNLIKDKLSLDFIDSIYEKDTLIPIHTTLRLINGGHYLVRQREESSILELIQTGIRPTKIIYPITKDINVSKQKLSELLINQQSMNVRVDKLINKPQIRVRQRGITTLLLRAQYPLEIIQIINELVKIKDPNEYSSPSSVSPTQLTEEFKQELEMENNKKSDPEIDQCTLYRLSLECLNRLALKGLMEEVGDDVIVNYILSTLSLYYTNIDIIVIGLKLLNDIVKALTRHVDQIFQVVMNSLQYYSPPPPSKAYSRVIKRLLPSQEEIERKQNEENEKMMRELKLKEEQDLLELESKICAKEQEVNKAAQQSITTKVTLPKTNVITLTKKQLKIQKQMRDRRERGDQLQQSSSSTTTTPFEGSLLPSNGIESNQNQQRRPVSQRSGRLPVAEIVNISRNHSNGTGTGAASSSHFHHHAPSSSTPPPPTTPTWKGPKLSRRPLKSLAEPTPKKKSIWSSFLNNGTLSFDLGGDTGGNFDLLEDNSSLPKVSGVKFTGIAGHQRSQIAFLQCIMTIYQYVSCHYANRECAYELFIHEELCDIGILCVHMPRVMSYILWTLDKIMNDRIEEAENRVQTQLARKKNISTTHDESESNLSVGSDYEKKNNINEVSKQIAALTKPVENILLFFAICSHMAELDENDRQLAGKWIGKWDDKSRSYQQLRDRGREIANM